MLTETFNENTNDKHVKGSSETPHGKGSGNLSDLNYEACDGRESSVDSEELIGVEVGGERENPGISRSVNNDYSKTDTNGTKTKLVADETSSSSFSLEISSNDFFQARKVNFGKSSASESASKGVQIDASHGTSKSIGGDRGNPEISRNDNNGYLIMDTDGTKSILFPDGKSSSSSSSESASNDSLQARKVNLVKWSASESALKDEDSVVSHGRSKSTGGERKNFEISRSGNNDYLKTDPNDTKSILVPDEASSFSSSSESSSNDFFQTRKSTFAESSSSKFASKDEESDVSHQSSINSEPDKDFTVRASTSPSYNLNRSHVSMSPTIAPPVQVMDRSSGHDSYRIPSSVFAINTNPMDWTNDSDESLFSIQLGNHSLARDHLFTAPELRKSVEVTKSGELNMFSPQPSVLIEDRDTCRKSVEIEGSQTTEMSDEDFELERSLDKNKNKIKNSHPAVSYNSHGNGIGAQSSALPILSEVKYHNSVKTDSPQVTSDSTSNCCNLCQCFSWLCCTRCCSHTDSPRQLSYDKASEKTSSSTSSCCSCFKCCSWSCCSWGKCSSLLTYSPPQRSYEDSEKNSSSTSHCCIWFQCFSGSCFCCCRSETDNTRHQSLDKASEKTSSSTSNCFHCCSWSCCSGENCCSQTDSPRHQSFDKTPEKTSSGKFCCCCC
ncbi:uncharacterized protein LOC114758683 [Neltuma alba]|uniref:uncharacterized protein LOC114758683 n=1 Tax=Neltuma alba TaxID=207710 RepID=UPI0010A5827C|nr:uncharacterized protein LOC114758683 [Prosopis alba]